MVIGKKGLANSNSSIHYELIENCKTENLLLALTFNQNATTEAPNLTYNALIPKLDKGQNLFIDININ